MEGQLGATRRVRMWREGLVLQWGWCYGIRPNPNRLARAREPRAEITGSRWQASTAEVRRWALSAGFELGSNGSIPEQAITAYNQIHPDRPY